MRFLIGGDDIYKVYGDESVEDLREEFFQALEEWKKADNDFRSDDPVVAQGALERKMGANAKLGLIKRLIKEKAAQN